MSNNNNSGGISFWGLLTIVLITLKLCNVITWSWWWVLFPLWLGIAFIICVAGLGVIVAAMMAIMMVIISWFKK